MNKTDSLTKLGSQKTKYNNSNPREEMFELFDNTAGEVLIPFVCNEFTSLCPKTGQPDFAKVEILYVPQDNGKCVESKSLKLYLFAFRGHGDFHEDCMAKISRDFLKVTNAKYIRVFGDFNVRGGISIKPLIEIFSEKLREQDILRIESKVESYDRLRHWDYQT